MIPKPLGNHVMILGPDVNEGNPNLMYFSPRYFTEVETRLWWATLQQHELYHYLFSVYPEFGLEKTGHMWFDRNKWPADFVGL